MKKLLLFLSMALIGLSGCVARGPHDDGYHRGHHHDKSHDGDKCHDNHKDGRDQKSDGKY